LKKFERQVGQLPRIRFSMFCSPIRADSDDITACLICIILIINLTSFLHSRLQTWRFAILLTCIFLVLFHIFVLTIKRSRFCCQEQGDRQIDRQAGDFWRFIHLSQP